MKTLHSDYEVLEKIGQGSQGTTFKARHTPTDDLVAIKVMDFGSVSDWKDVELFEREAAALEKLSHPSIPRYIDTWTLEEDGSLQMCLAQQFIEGQNLRDELTKGGKWTGKQALDALEQLLQTLVYLHNRVPPVIHRDIKPNNIIRKHNGELVLADFGAVQTQQHGTVGGSTVIGTPGYMPMEQMIGQAEPRSDLYALGVTVGRMLTGLEPSKTPLTKNRFDFRAQLQHIDSDTHRALAVIEGLTQPSKENRFPSASAALDALQAPQLAQPPAPQTLPLPQDPTTELHGHPTKHASDFEPWFQAVRQWVQDAKSGVPGKAAYTIVDRPRTNTPSPQEQKLIDLGFEFMGRQTAIKKGRLSFASTATTRSVWRGPKGVVYAIHNEGQESIDLFVYFDDGKVLTTQNPDEDETEDKDTTVYGSDEVDWALMQFHRRIKSQPERAPIVGLDIDRFMLLNDANWFRNTRASLKKRQKLNLQAPPQTPKAKGTISQSLSSLIEGLLYLLALGMAASSLVVGSIIVVIGLALFLLGWYYLSQTSHSRYKETLKEIQQEAQSAHPPQRHVLPELAPHQHTLPQQTNATAPVHAHTQAR